MAKIRLGFVSNSSSSSFIICGKKLEKCPETYDVKLYAIGNYGYEGEDFFEVTKEIFNFMKRNPDGNYNLDFYLVERMTETDSIRVKEIKNLPDECEIWLINKDYHCTDTLEDFKDRYFG